MSFSTSFCDFFLGAWKLGRGSLVGEEEREGEKKGKKRTKNRWKNRKIHFLLKIFPYQDFRFPSPRFSTPVHLPPPLPVSPDISYLFRSGRPGPGIAIPVARASRVCLCQARASPWNRDGIWKSIHFPSLGVRGLTKK